MAYAIEFSREARAHLDRPEIRRAKGRLLQEIAVQLAHEPMREITNRFAMEPNSLATWELRVHSFRVYYDVDEDEQSVWIAAVGVKVGNTVYIGGREVDLHE